MRLIIAACSAFEVTLYVSKDWEVNFAACLAVAHSPSAGALSQDLEVGAMDAICDSVIVSRWKRGKAVERDMRERERREGRCILEWKIRFR